MAHAQPAPWTVQAAAIDASTAPEAKASGVSWAAVFAGAFATSALLLIMFAIGAGFGLAAASPWPNVGISATAASWAAIIWLIVSWIVAASIGGYLAGRLRVKWSAVHTDEVFFRDTAHGFLAWAVGLVMTAAFVSSLATFMSGSAVAGATPSPTSTTAAGTTAANNYFVDMLFRSERVAAEPNDAALRSEAGLILAHSVANGGVSAADRTYLTQLVSARTGLNAQEADQRVSQATDAALQAADTARKDVAHVLLWLALALLIGAFCASYSATMGGRLRDNLRAV